MRKLVLAGIASTMLAGGPALAQGVPPNLLQPNQPHPNAIFEPSQNATGKTGWFANLLGLGHPDQTASESSSQATAMAVPQHR